MNEPRPRDQEWDVFISYAREDHLSARDLQDALHRCTTAAGRRPRVYLDVSREGTTPGEHFEQFLEKTLAASRYIVALYSPRYFQKKLCQWELHQALMLQRYEGTRLIPLLIDPAAAEQVPYVASKIHWLHVTRPDWFEELRQLLGLASLADTRRTLRFANAVPDVLVNHTLPELRVTISGPDGAPDQHGGEAITITAEPAEARLSGTLSVPAQHGTALFRDLSFPAPVGEVRLVASVPGCDSVVTPPLQVRPSEPTAKPPGTRTTLETSGRPIFFPDGKTLAVLDGDRLTVHAPGTGAAADPARLAERVRLWARGTRCLAVADWSGRVVVAEPNGTVRVADLTAPPGDQRLNVPGALAFRGDDLLVGMWNGTVWSVPADGSAPQQVWHHPAGVQQLVADDDGLLICGLGGRLTVYPGGPPPSGPGASYALEPLLLGAIGIPGFALIVGERGVHRLDKAAARLRPFELPITPISRALPGPELSVIIDAEGRGICFDSELRVRVGFHTVPGARPVCADQTGQQVVFTYPDGSYALMREGRIVFTTAQPLAVSPSGDLAALSSGTEMVLLPLDELSAVRTDLP